MTVCMFLNVHGMDMNVSSVILTANMLKGMQINLTIKFNKEVQSQVGVNIDGGFQLFLKQEKKLQNQFIPDNDYLNIQIADLMGNESVGIVSITVDVTQKGAGTSSSSEGKGTKKYTKKGDYLCSQVKQTSLRNN